MMRKETRIVFGQTLPVSVKTAARRIWTLTLEVQLSVIFTPANTSGMQYKVECFWIIYIVITVYNYADFYI